MDCVWYIKFKHTYDCQGISSSSSQGGAVGIMCCSDNLSVKHTWSDTFSKNGKGQELSLTVDGRGWYDVRGDCNVLMGTVPITMSNGNFTLRAIPAGFIANWKIKAHKTLNKSVKTP